jgi:hypothetical protein
VKQNDRKPWLQKPWGLPAVRTAFVAAMEDVLEVSAEP